MNKDDGKIRFIDNGLRIAAKNRLSFITLVVRAHDQKIAANLTCLVQEIPANGAGLLEPADRYRDTALRQIPREVFHTGTDNFPACCEKRYLLGCMDQSSGLRHRAGGLQ